MILDRNLKIQMKKPDKNAKRRNTASLFVFPRRARSYAIAGAASAGAASVSGGNVPKAIEALGVLGYSPSDVSPVLATLDSSLPVEQLIAQTLKQMGRQ